MASNIDPAQIEAMNKVRISLGMAPLPVSGDGNNEGLKFQSSSAADAESDEEDDLSTLEKRHARAGDNWMRLEAERREKQEREARKVAAKKARDAAQRFAKLEGKGLGEDDGEGDMDTRRWLLGKKKREREIEKARKMAAELAEREAYVQEAEYSAKDLVGVKVGHEVAAFEDGEGILTLKDAEIGEESEEDELESLEVRARERLKERMVAKSKRIDYDPTEQGEKKGVLEKYDEEIEGKKRKAFMLDGHGGVVELKTGGEADVEEKRKGIKISLDVLEDVAAPPSDYVDPGPVKVRKPKKEKKEKKTRRRTANDDDDEVSLSTDKALAKPPLPDGDTMEIDAATTNKKRTLDVFDDDEDLQARLAEQRRAALKKRKKTDAAELARQMREETAFDDAADGEEEGGLVVDETSEFVANLKKPETLDQPRRSAAAAARAASPDEDTGEDEDGDRPMRHVSTERETSAPVNPDVSATGLEEEDTLTGQGIGASLHLLRQRGLLPPSSSEELTEKERQRARFLAEKQRLIDEYDARARDQREADRRSGRWERMSHRERDAYARAQNEAREQYVSRLQAELFAQSYRPDVRLEYYDEFGRAMGQKEAFKHLSHMFHGKGSGKGKTEKRLKKIEGEKKEAGKGILGESGAEGGGFVGVQGREGRRMGVAGVRLQ